MRAREGKLGGEGAWAAGSATDHARGPEDARVTLLEYADFECPYSATARTVLRRVEEKLGGELRFVFRNFPRALHPHAVSAARVAEAAALQGKFWEVHDALFEQHEKVTRGDLLTVVEGIVDVALLRRDMAGARVRARVEADVRRGQASGVDITPAFFVNERSYAGAWDYTTLLRRLELALREPSGA